jgi:hypothetical protein
MNTCHNSISAQFFFPKIKISGRCFHLPATSTAHNKGSTIDLYFFPLLVFNWYLFLLLFLFLYILTFLIAYSFVPIWKLSSTIREEHKEWALRTDSGENNWTSDRRVNTTAQCGNSRFLFLYVDMRRMKGQKLMAFVWEKYC